jgi:GntR family transcriptional regulator
MSTLLPIYYQIKQTIRAWLMNKDFKPGQKIPSENELSQMFAVSKMTVRQAINQLVQEGLLISKKGSGTFVSEKNRVPDKYSIEFAGSMDQIFNQAQKARSKSVVMAPIKAFNSIRAKLNLSEEEKTVMQIKRVRQVKDIPFSYAVNYLPLDIGLKVKKKVLLSRPLLQILEQDLKISFMEAYQTIEASFSDTEVSEKLGIPLGTPLLFVDRIMYTDNKKPVLLAHISYRGDMFKYIARFKSSKRKKRHAAGIQPLF